MVTVVSMKLIAVAVYKTPSPSSRPTRARRKSQWGMPAGGDFRKEIQPESIDFFSRKTLADRGRAAPFLLPNGECAKFRLAVRPPFSKGDEHRGAIRRWRGKSPFPLGERKAFLICSVKSAFALLLTKVTKPGSRRKGSDWIG